MLSPIRLASRSVTRRPSRKLKITPHMLKGLYLCLDYNRNPIARRILFIKHSDSTDMDDFLALKGCIIPREELSEELMPYYNYTCQPGDFIKTCNVPSPLLNEKDLEKEKKMLAI